MRLMAEYYVQRASAGLILTEATSVNAMGVGYPDTPGIWSQAQLAGWRLVTDAVHAAGGRIFLQLWHVGRVSAPVYLKWCESLWRQAQFKPGWACQSSASCARFCHTPRDEP